MATAIENKTSNEVGSQGGVQAEFFAQSGATAGELIKTARLQQGITILILANRLKVSSDKIDALERNQHHLVGDLVFIRALTQSICKILNIEYQTILALLPKMDLNLCESDQIGKSSLYRNKMQDVRLDSKWVDWSRIKIISPINWIMLVVFVVVLATSFWWYFEIDHAISEQSTNIDNANVELYPSTAVLSETQSTDLKVNTPKTIESPHPAVDQVLASDSVQVSVINDLNTDLPKASILSESASATLKPEKNDSLNLKFIAHADSWVSITDENNKVIYSGLIKLGETQNIYAPPFSKLVIGNAVGMNFEMNGKLIDITTLAKNNVFRTVLK